MIRYAVPVVSGQYVNLPHTFIVLPKAGSTAHWLERAPGYEQIYLHQSHRQWYYKVRLQRAPAYIEPFISQCLLPAATVVTGR